MIPGFHHPESPGPLCLEIGSLIQSDPVSLKEEEVREGGGGEKEREWTYMKIRRRQPSASQGEGPATDLSLMALRRNQPSQHLDLGHLDFRIVKQHIP